MMHEGVCTGAECPYCYPSLACLDGRSCFRDSRGLPISSFPTAVRPSATIILVEHRLPTNRPWRVLVHQRSDNGWWGFPGGRQEIGESLQDCARREAYEETGYEVALYGAVAIDSDPYLYALVVYPDAVIHYTNVTFLAEIVTGELRCSTESRALLWTFADDLPAPFMPSHHWRLAQALAHTGAFVPVR